MGPFKPLTLAPIVVKEVSPGMWVCEIKFEREEEPLPPPAKPEIPSKL